MRPLLTWIAFFLLLAGQVFLILIPWLPATADWLDQWSEKTSPLEAHLSIVGLHASLMMIFFGLAFREMLASLRDEKRQIERALNSRSEVTPLRDDEFYDAFAVAASKASSRVSICYLAPNPPPDHADRQRYYRKMLSVMKKSPNVRFRRLIRDTPNNRPWVASLISELEGSPNADVALLRDSEALEMPLALSTQLVDYDQTWFVAIDAHDRVGKFRDLYVRDTACNSLMDKYFERLWNRAEVVLASGQFTDVGRPIANKGAAK